MSEKKNEYEIELDDIYAHIEHIIDVSSINYMSFGSDYDGAKVPAILKDISWLS